MVGTHGRSFWILDDITPLRQVDARVLAAAAFLYEPQQATRVRWSLNTDTPLPPDEPAGQNPPDGAVINYWLKSATEAVSRNTLAAIQRLPLQTKATCRRTGSARPPCRLRPPACTASCGTCITRRRQPTPSLSRLPRCPATRRGGRAALGGAAGTLYGHARGWRRANEPATGDSDGSAGI